MDRKRRRLGVPFTRPVTFRRYPLSEVFANEIINEYKSPISEMKRGSDLDSQPSKKDRDSPARFNPKRLAKCIQHLEQIRDEALDGAKKGSGWIPTLEELITPITRRTWNSLRAQSKLRILLSTRQMTCMLLMVRSTKEGTQISKKFLMSLQEGEELG